MDCELDRRVDVALAVMWAPLGSLETKKHLSREMKLSIYQFDLQSDPRLLKQALGLHRENEE